MKNIPVLCTLKPPSLLLFYKYFGALHLKNQQKYTNNLRQSRLIFVAFNVASKFEVQSTEIYTKRKSYNE